MAGQYGQASAGEGRNLGETCKGVICDASDYTAWREAGLHWVAFYNSLDLEAVAKLGPQETWSSALKAGRPGASTAAGDLLEAEPWVYTSAADVLKVAEAQQTLRDYCGLLAEALEKVGAPVAPPPAEPPPPPPSAGATAASILGTVTTLAAIAVGGYLLSKVLSR